MKVINNQWQLSSAICLLIITLLTLFLLVALKLAIILPSWAYFMLLLLSLKRGSVSFYFNVLSLYIYIVWLLCMCLSVGIIDWLRVQRDIHAVLFFIFTYTVLLPAHSRVWKHNFTPAEGRIQWGICSIRAHNPCSIILLQETLLVYTVLQSDKNTKTYFSFYTHCAVVACPQLSMM